MNIRYLFLSALLVTLGVIMVFLPEKKYSEEVKPESLLLELTDDTRYVSTDQVAHHLIEGDPQVQLIDVRTADEYAKFSLPGAINIPLDSILTETAEAYLSQEGMQTIFYSNGTVYASQAWMLYRRKAFEGIYIMKGGLNQWVETILKPTAPRATAPAEAFNLYETRLAASRFFGGGSAVTSPSGSKAPRPKVKRKAKKAAKGGC